MITPINRVRILEVPSMENDYFFTVEDENGTGRHYVCGLGKPVGNAKVGDIYSMELVQEPSFSFYRLTK